MTQFLPPNLLALFQPRDPIPYLPPVDKLPYEKQSAGYSGLASFVKYFEDPAETPPPVKIETREERQEIKRKLKAELVAYKLEQDIALWQPNNNPNATSDPYKTLFVARLNYETSESKILREFQVYGPIRKVVKVHNNANMKPRGYAFIEYEHERDMHSAYKHADGKKLSNRRVLVDVERGRTVKGWLPRRLGGGLGGTRKGGPDVNIKHSGREETAPDSRYIGGGGGMKDRNMDRDRERPERPERRRSRSRERRRRSRSRSRDRRREERRKRDRSRDRSDRGRGDHDTGSTVEKAEGAVDGVGEGGPEAEPPRKERRRSRSRDRERKHRRSRSRDRKRRDHDRDRDRDRDRESRRERGGAEREERNERPPPAAAEEEVSQPPEPAPEDFNNSGYEGEYNNFNNNGETNFFEGY